MRPGQWIFPFIAGLLGLVAPLTASVGVDELLRFGKAIDQAVDAGLRDHDIRPRPVTDDATFARRVHLDIIGRIPTVIELDAFLTGGSADRRVALIEQLLASPGAVHHQFTWWADLLRMQNRSMGGNGDPYIDWIKQAIRENKPFDQMARELLTAEGAVYQRGNGATGYYVRDRGMPLDNYAATTQVFLATRMGCAQCHNHPFDTWTRHQFMQMAAFTGNVTVGADPAVAKVLKEFKGDRDDPDVKAVIQDLGLNGNNAVLDKDKATLAVPKDYQYPDLKKGGSIAACTVMGETVNVAKGERPRQVYATWMTSPDNPRFTRTVANRLWKRAMGIGVFEPVDDLREDTVIAQPALMKALEDAMRAVRFDLRAFQSILYATKAYQRQAAVQGPKPGEGWWFPGPVLRRLTAEQIWDSLLTLVIPEPDARLGVNESEKLYVRYEDLLGMGADELVEYVKEQVDLRKRRKELQDQLAALRKEKGVEAVQDPAFKPAQAALNELNAQAGAMVGLSKKRRGASTEPRGIEQDPNSQWKGFPRNLVRAAELPSPAPLGHFLRDFGQSDRMAIENGSLDPGITQCLNLLNGLVDAEVLQPRSVLLKALAALVPPPTKPVPLAKPTPPAKPAAKPVPAAKPAPGAAVVVISKPSPAEAAAAADQAARAAIVAADQAARAATAAADQAKRAADVVADQAARAATAIAKEQIALIFRSLLGRPPTARELTILKPETRTTPAAIADAVWAVFNTGEFLFIR